VQGGRRLGNWLAIGLPHDHSSITDKNVKKIVDVNKNWSMQSTALDRVDFFLFNDINILYPISMTI